MKTIKFRLSGKTGFFKKPDVNVNTYFTYNNIHKIALLGMLGAIIGLEGHNQQSRKIKEGLMDKTLEYPEFYDRLKNLKVSIVPEKDRGYFAKKVQVFNNGVGYASQEDGGNLVVREQWLENPCWTIYILNDGSIDSQIMDKLQQYLLSGKCVYIPYLGKNDHPALVEDCELVELDGVEDITHIDSLFIYDAVEIGDDSYNDEDDVFMFKEMSPTSLKEKYNFYEFSELCFTNLEVYNINAKENLYKDKERILAFY
jgi:CRISPR-associated protein Cas5h